MIFVYCFIGLFITGIYVLVTFLTGFFLSKKESFILDFNFIPVDFISVLIPARNEEDNIEKCLNSILNQEYPNHLFEVIVVDDFSTDQTTLVVENLKFRYSNLKLIKLSESGLRAGKKAAIETGVKNAKGSIIITSDADCLVQPQWLLAYSQFFKNTACEMACGPVALNFNKNNFFQKWQSLEFSALIAFTEAFIDWEIPVMCNGANLAYKKDSFLKVKGYSSNIEIASGDDVFLMMKFQKHFSAKKIRFIKNPQVLVTTSAVTSLSKFIQQRKRWAGKSIYLKNTTAILLGLLVLLTNASQFISFLLAPFHETLFYLFLLITCLKFVADYAFFLMIKPFKFKWMLSCLLGQFVNMAYVPLTLFLSIIGRYSWKGRILK